MNAAPSGHRFQSPIARGGHWSECRYLWIAPPLKVSVPYRSGRPLEQGNSGSRRMYMRFSPLSLGEAIGALRVEVFRGAVLDVSVPYRSGRPLELGRQWVQRHPHGVSVPYRSGRPLELQQGAGAEQIRDQFQSPIARGGHWSRCRPGSTCSLRRSFSPLSLGEAIGAWPGRARCWSSRRFQSPIARGGHWSRQGDDQTSLLGLVSVPYRSGRPLELGNKTLAFLRLRFQSPIARGGHWS